MLLWRGAGSARLKLDMSFIPTVGEMLHRFCTLNLKLKFNQFVLGICAVRLWERWKTRKRIVFQDIKTEFSSCIMRIWNFVMCLGFVLKGKDSGVAWQRETLRSFKISI